MREKNKYAWKILGISETPNNFLQYLFLISARIELQAMLSTLQNGLNELHLDILGTHSLKWRFPYVLQNNLIGV